MPAPETTVDLSALAPALTDTCSEYVQRYRKTFVEGVDRGVSGIETTHDFAAAFDGLLGALFCAAEASAPRPAGASRVALVGVGGYGRGTLGLYSDIDVLFLCDDPEDARVHAIASGLLYPLWDLGLDIGHAVRGIDETLSLAREDIRTTTTLLDLRWVAGDRKLVGELASQARRRVLEPGIEAFLDALAEDTARRHQRFGGSLYLLEPEVKQGRGGLRDLDVTRWAAGARWGGAGFDAFVRSGALLAREVAELRTAQEMLWRTRNFLHVRTRRQQDRLTFADQEDIATRLGFVDGIVLGVEQYMQAYYRHAEIVAISAERMLDRARPRRHKSRKAMRPIGDGTAVFDDHITLVESSRLVEDPALAFRAFRQIAARELPIYPFARDAIARMAPDRGWAQRARDSEEATQLFVQLMAHRADVPSRRGSIVEEMHDVGLTRAMIPELRPLIGRVMHDVFHVYTVDVHAIRSVDFLRDLMQGKRSELPLATRLASEVPRRAPLFLATFLHAIGKVGGYREADLRGAEMVEPIAHRLGFGEVDVEHIVFLVREQRRLYRWATRRDTSDPAVLRELAESVGSVDRLRDLYLLTVSTLAAANPAALTAWKARVLRDLYIGVVEVFEQGAESVSGRAAELREALGRALEGTAGAEVRAFLQGMPDRYVLATPDADVLRHARVVNEAFRSGESIRVEIAPGDPERGELDEVLVLCADRPGLLADVAAVLAAHRLTIVDAQIFTPEAAGGVWAFDVFHIRRESSRYEDPVSVDPSLRAKIEKDLRARFAGEVSADELFARRPKAPAWAERKSPDVEVDIVIDNDVSGHATVVDVFTRDRPGVVYCIARALHELGLSIDLAKLNAEGHRVADIFYVQRDGEKVWAPETQQAIRARIRESLTRLEETDD